jgi:hypothetical protein
MTEGQRRAASVAAQLSNEMQTLGQLEQPSTGGVIARALPFGAGRSLMSGNTQAYMDAISSFAQHYIYGLSGAAAPDAEVERVAAAISPRLGDSDEAKARKAQRMRDMVRNLEIMAAGGSVTDALVGATGGPGGTTYSPDNPFMRQP